MYSHIHNLVFINNNCTHFIHMIRPQLYKKWTKTINSRGWQIIWFDFPLSLLSPSDKYVLNPTVFDSIQGTTGKTMMNKQSTCPHRLCCLMVPFPSLLSKSRIFMKCGLGQSNSMWSHSLSSKHRTHSLTPPI